MNTNKLLIDILKKMFANDFSNISMSNEQFIELITEARTQHLDSLVINYISKTVDQNVISNFSNYKKESIIKTLINSSKYRGVEIISKVLNQNNIDYVYLKGPCYKNVYLQPEIRLLSDFDILVKPESLDFTVEVLLSIGYEVDKKRENEYNLYLVHNDYLPIELHFKLTIDKELNYHNDFMNQMFIDKIFITENKENIFVPNIENTIVYSLMHMMKHLYTTGFGLRQFYDFALFSYKYKDVINYNLLDIYLRKYKLGRLYRSLVYLVSRELKIHLGMDSYTKETNEIKYFSECLLDFMFVSGVYGHKNQLNDSVSFIRKYSTTNLMNRINKLSIVFPSKKNLSTKYKYAKNNGLLLPLAWIHRLISSKKNFRKVDTFKYNDKIMETINKRNEMVVYFMSK